MIESVQTVSKHTVCIPSVYCVNATERHRVDWIVSSKEPSKINQSNV